MRETIKRLSVGLLEDLFRTYLLLIAWAFMYAIWLFIIGIEMLHIPLEESVKALINSIFLAVMLMIITYFAVKSRHIGEIYGFKEK